MVQRNSTAGFQRTAAFAVLVTGVILFLVLRSVLSAPTGEGVPGPGPECARGQSTAQTVGIDNWCQSQSP